MNDWGAGYRARDQSMVRIRPSEYFTYPWVLYRRRLPLARVYVDDKRVATRIHDQAQQKRDRGNGDAVLFLTQRDELTLFIYYRY